MDDIQSISHNPPGGGGTAVLKGNIEAAEVLYHVPPALHRLERLRRVHDRDIHALRIQQQIEPRPVGTDDNDLRIALGVPIPALERHDDRTFVGIVASDHAPTPAAQVFSRGQAGPCRDLLGTAADGRCNDDRVAVVALIGKNELRAH
jgi:hypothetical protein